MALAAGRYTVFLTPSSEVGHIACFTPTTKPSGTPLSWGTDTSWSLLTGDYERPHRVRGRGRAEPCLRRLMSGQAWGSGLQRR